VTGTKQRGRIAKMVVKIIFSSKLYEFLIPR